MKVGDLVKLKAAPERGTIYPTKIKDGAIGILLRCRHSITRIDCLVDWGGMPEWVFRGRLEVISESR